MPQPRYACFTLDYELDYGGRLRQFDTLKQRRQHEELARFLHDESIPLSAFIQTQTLKDYPESETVIRSLASDFHSHSHTHASKGFASREEFITSKKIIEDTFGQQTVGYRAPFGKLYPGDHELLSELNFSFDASIFPSYRPGKFNHLSASIEPTRLPCGLQEIPFAVIPKVRLILGISYMKLLGYGFYENFMKVFGLPEVVVFYGHMHDYFPTPGVNTLPLPLRKAFNRNSGQALAITKKFMQHLKRNQYQMVTMSALAHVLKDRAVR